MLFQAWTAVQIFNEGYVPTQLYQLPLFHGPPKPYLLRALAKDNTRQWIVANVVNGNVSSMPRACLCATCMACNRAFLCLIYISLPPWCVIIATMKNTCSLVLFS